MNKARQARLEAKGWKFGSAADFLGLTPEELAYIDLKIALGDHLQTKRLEQELTQSFLATKLHSSQSRVAKMEKGDPSVSLDLLIKSLYALGTDNAEIASVIAERPPLYEASSSRKRR
jgi:DNA-binding XRE family transcriptional regulator